MVGRIAYSNTLWKPTWLDTLMGGIFTSTNQGMGAQHAESHTPMPRDVYSSFRQYRNM